MRTYTILDILIHADAYVSLGIFANKMGVSKRTIQNELASLRKISKKYGFKIISSYGKGYTLEVSDSKLFDDFMRSLSKDSSIQNERQFILDTLAMLLNSGGEYMSVSDIIEVLGISDTLAYKKLDVVESFVNSFGMELERRSYYGIRLKGSSRKIRSMMFELYFKGDEQFKDIVEQNIGNFDQVIRKAENLIKRNNLRIGYLEFQELIVWLKIFVSYSVLFKTSKSQNFSQSDFSNVQKNLLIDLLYEVAKNFNVQISEDLILEFNEFTSHIVQNKNDIKQNKKIDRDFLKGQVIDFFKESDKENQTDYHNDLQFIDGLTSHLLFLIERIDDNVTYKSPLLLELCIRYPYVFDLVLKFSDFLNQHFQINISSDELGFIVIHFLNHVVRHQNQRVERYDRIAVVCTSGGGSSNLIKTQIQNIFQNSVIRPFSFLEESELEIFKPNLIFSVVPLKKTQGVPIIYIREFLTDKEIENIKHVLSVDELTNETVTQEYIKSDFLQLIKPDLFHVYSGQTYKDVISTMAIEMINKGYADPDFMKNVLIRERYMSTIYNHGIAMPHPIEMNGLSSAVSVGIVKPTILDYEKEVKLIFMVCLAKKDFRFYSNISDTIFELMQNNSKIIQIYNDPTFSTLIGTLKGI